MADFLVAPVHNDKRRKDSKLSIRLCMWEFGQNDPKRDSGSKMVRFGYAGLLKIGQSFQGIVLSSEATTLVTQADAYIIADHGIAGINCSWNRLDEIPFDKMGKGKHQRILPKLLAANSVNYGKPFKMNTAEAMAATLYIAGYKEQAHTLMEPFSYGPEFLRLNYDALERFSACKNHKEAVKVQEEMDRINNAKIDYNTQRKEDLRSQNGCVVNNYLSDMDLPPMDDDEYYYYGEEEEENEEEVTPVQTESNAAGTTEVNDPNSATNEMNQEETLIDKVKILRIDDAEHVSS